MPGSRGIRGTHADAQCAERLKKPLAHARGSHFSLRIFNPLQSRDRKGAPSGRYFQQRLSVSALLLLPFALSAILSGQTPPSAPASVSGTVTNSATGEPILRAHVQLRANDNGSPHFNPQSYGSLTNQEGKFTIAPLPEGRYYISVSRVGFVAAPEMPA
jgi:hypothetical protein